MATITRHVSVLAVSELSRSADFYRHVLGFEIHEMGDPPGAPPGARLSVYSTSRRACRIV